MTTTKPEAACGWRSLGPWLLGASAVTLVLAGCSSGDGPTPPPEPTTGTVEVSAATAGDTLDRDGYTVTLDGGASISLTPDGTAVFEDVEPGEHEVELSDVQPNCEPAGGAVAPISVAAGATASATFDVECRPALLDRIVFTSRRSSSSFDVHVVQPGGTGLTRLTENGVFDNDPDVTEDGTRLVFASGVNITVMNVDGSNRTELAGASDGQEFGTRWSPDGTRIVFWDSGRDEIWTMDADGSDLERLTDNEATDRGPVWSPDGSRIAFASDRSGSREIWIMDADGSNPVQVTDQPAVASFAPAWNPDGSTIAFARFDSAAGDTDIYTIAVDGTDLQQVTSGPALDENPDWSPDGTRLVFQRFEFEEDDTDVFVIEVDGTQRTRVAEDPASDADPIWTPGR